MGFLPGFPFYIIGKIQGQFDFTQPITTNVPMFL